MAQVNHKLVQPIQPGIGQLHFLILCWRINGIDSAVDIRDVVYSTNVNHVNCPECIDCWNRGIYR